MLECIIVSLFCLIILGLLLENKLALHRRQQLKHVIYVNGTRGKSTVTRLIDAGLRQGGYRVFCKTTGTVPLIIDGNQNEKRIVRRGKPNIKEQLWVLKKAYRDKVDILVCECMAIAPELQRISQDKMLKSDIGVITNVRHDHMEEMGWTLPEICDALSNTIPENGVLFTADAEHYPQLKANASHRQTKVILSECGDGFGDEIFKENSALALAVCESLGVPKDIAVKGMLEYKKDPYALSLFQFKGGCIFVNGLSINDSDSTESVYSMLRKHDKIKEKKCILLVNSRADRMSRAKQMLEFAIKIHPSEVWLMGSMKYKLKKALTENNIPVSSIKSVQAIDFDRISEQYFIYAIGNIACEGMQLMKKIEMEGLLIG